MKFKGKGLEPPSKRNGWTATVKITQTDIFENLLNIIGGMLADERIDQGVRVEYSNEIRKLTERGAKEDDN